MMYSEILGMFVQHLYTRHIWLCAFIDFHQVGDGSTNPAGIPEGALAGPENANQPNGVPLTG
jgi:hypothetical protein